MGPCVQSSVTQLTNKKLFSPIPLYVKSLIRTLILSQMQPMLLHLVTGEISSAFLKVCWFNIMCNIAHYIFNFIFGHFCTLETIEFPPTTIVLTFYNLERMEKCDVLSFCLSFSHFKILLC